MTENDYGAYYASGRSTVEATPEFTLSKDVLTSNRYEGVVLEEGKALLNTDTINGTGRVGIDVLQFQGCPPANAGEFCQLSASARLAALNVSFNGASSCSFSV